MHIAEVIERAGRLFVVMVALVLKQVWKLFLLKQRGRSKHRFVVMSVVGNCFALQRVFFLYFQEDALGEASHGLILG